MSQEMKIQETVKFISGELNFRFSCTNIQNSSIRKIEILNFSEF